MDWLRKYSLKRALCIYILVAISAAIVMIMLVNVFCENWVGIIYKKYDLFNDIRPMSAIMNTISPVDRAILKSVSSVKTASFIVIPVITILITSSIFYKNRIEEPVSILIKEADKIKHNDLSFSCCYKSGDEMGEICESFEKMRLQLIKNQKDVWRVTDQQRQLNSAFAHDLRTPLTVIEGYTEMLLKYYPEGKISEEKLIKNIRLIEEQTVRLKRFSETMKGINNLSCIELKCTEQNLNVIPEKLHEIINGIKENSDININVVNNMTLSRAYFDEHIIIEVLENLISNALSFAHSKVDIILETEKEKLNIYVRDDGRGFSKDEIYKASRPYYTSRSDKSEHFGLGLTISKILCEKHGGTIFLSNSIDGGAIICASFYVQM